MHVKLYSRDEGHEKCVGTYYTEHIPRAGELVILDDESYTVTNICYITYSDCDEYDDEEAVEILVRETTDEDW